MRCDEARLDRQLGGAEAQRLLGELDRHAVDLEHDAAGLDARDPEFRRALALAHAHFGGFFDTGTSGKMRIQTGRRASCGA